MEESSNEQPLRRLFEHLITKPELHARFLNTLSFMELCGASKLAALKTSGAASTFWLEHVAEEYRHAFFLRTLASKIHQHFDSYNKHNVLGFYASKNYIALIDIRLCRLLKRERLFSPAHVYALTTLVIELRALPFYRCYQEALDAHGIGISVKSIISEEEHHLQEISTLIENAKLSVKIINEARWIEESLYQTWIHELSHTIKHVRLAPTS